MIKIVGHSKSSPDGIETKFLGDSTFYYLDSVLLLQVEMDLNTMQYNIIYVCSVLTKEEKEIFNRLVDRLKLPNLRKENFIIDNLSLSI